MADGDLFVPAALSPKNSGNFPVARNTDVLGAHQFVASIANLTDSTIRSGIRTSGMFASCLDTRKVYELGADLTTWTEKLFTSSGNRYKRASTAAMQAIATATVGDDCCVSDSTSDTLWIFVASGKYTHGANVLAGIGGDWLYEIDCVMARIPLSGSPTFYYLPGLTSAAQACVSYYQTIGQSGTLEARPITNGVNIYSSAGSDDASTVTLEIVI